MNKFHPFPFIGGTNASPRNRSASGKSTIDRKQQSTENRQSTEIRQSTENRHSTAAFTVGPFSANKRGSELFSSEVFQRLHRNSKLQSVQINIGGSISVQSDPAYQCVSLCVHIILRQFSHHYKVLRASSVDRTLEFSSAILKSNNAYISSSFH